MPVIYLFNKFMPICFVTCFHCYLFVTPLAFWETWEQGHLFQGKMEQMQNTEGNRGTEEQNNRSIETGTLV